MSAGKTIFRSLSGSTLAINTTPVSAGVGETTAVMYTGAGQTLRIKSVLTPSDTQMITGKTFGDNIVGPAAVLTSTSNQLTLGNTTTTTITAPTPGASRVYTIADAGAPADFVMTAGTQTIGGDKTFSSAVTVSTGTNQIVLGSTTLNAPGGTPRVINLVDPGVTGNIIASTNTPTTGQYLVATGTSSASWQTVSISGGATTVGTPITAPDGNGGAISGSTLTLYTANASFPGMITAAAQTIAGAKTFTGGVVFGGAGVQVNLNTYEILTATAITFGSANGPTFATNVNLSVMALGGVLMVSITAESGNINFGTAGTYVTYTLPVRFAPPQARQTQVRIRNANANVMSTSELLTDGTLRIYANINTTTNWPNIGNSGIIRDTIIFSIV